MGVVVLKKALMKSVFNLLSLIFFVKIEQVRL